MILFLVTMSTNPAIGEQKAPPAKINFSGSVYEEGTNRGVKGYTIICGHYAWVRQYIGPGPDGPWPTKPSKQTYKWKYKECVKEALDSTYECSIYTPDFDECFPIYPDDPDSLWMLNRHWGGTKSKTTLIPPPGWRVVGNPTRESEEGDPHMKGLVWYLKPKEVKEYIWVEYVRADCGITGGEAFSIDIGPKNVVERLSYDVVAIEEEGRITLNGWTSNDPTDARVNLHLRAEVEIFPPRKHNPKAMVIICYRGRQEPPSNPCIYGAAVRPTIMKRGDPIFLEIRTVGGAAKKIWRGKYSRTGDISSKGKNSSVTRVTYN
jgi:hypothetical protein